MILGSSTIGTTTGGSIAFTDPNGNVMTQTALTEAVSSGIISNPVIPDIDATYPLGGPTTRFTDIFS
jgi:hypothetical protein